MSHFSWLFKKNKHFLILTNFSQAPVVGCGIYLIFETALESINTQMIIFIEYFKVCISESGIVGG